MGDERRVSSPAGRASRVEGFSLLGIGHVQLRPGRDSAASRSLTPAAELMRELTDQTTTLVRKEGKPPPEPPRRRAALAVLVLLVTGAVVYSAARRQRESAANTSGVAMTSAEPAPLG